MTADPINVLVLGVGSHVSQGILKALAKSRLRVRVIGTCLGPGSEFLYFVDRAILQPMLEDGEDAFKEWLVALCEAEKVQIILSGIEPVIRFLSQHAAEITARTHAIPIAAAPGILKIGQSKLLTCQWLEEHSFGFPRYATWQPGEDWDAFATAVGYPIIAKPIHGKGSQGIHLLRDRDDLPSVRQPESYIFQEHIGSDDSEYTVGCFRSPNTLLVDCIVMKRVLSRGFTYQAEIVDHPVISEECRKIVERLGITGPCNIQLRLHRERPCCFEINARFSGTTPIRAHYGFNDVEASIRHFLLGETERLPKITSGLAYRYWNEAYIDPRARDVLRAAGKLNPGEYPGDETDSFGLRK